MISIMANGTLTSTTREDVRAEVIEWFLQEIPGTKTKDSVSYYDYFVENYDGYQIILKRPVMLNKGFDFTVNIFGNDIQFPKNRNKNAPKQTDAINALIDCMKQDPDFYELNIKPILNQIFNCYPIALNNSCLGYFSIGSNMIMRYPIEIMLLAIKWLFIEQDIRYWNFSGRQMLFNLLKENSLI